VAGLSGDPTQLLYNKPSLMVVCWFSAPLCCNCLTISMNKSHKHFSCCQSLAPLVLTNSLSLNTYCSDCLIWVVTLATTLIGTFVGFRWFRYYCGIITNKFSSGHVLYLNFLGAFSLSMFYTITNYTRVMNEYFS